jgi:hypothetical protein
VVIHPGTPGFPGIARWDADAPGFGRTIGFMAGPTGRQTVDGEFHDATRSARARAERPSRSNAAVQQSGTGNDPLKPPPGGANRRVPEPGQTCPVRTAASRYPTAHFRALIRVERELRVFRNAWRSRPCEQAALAQPTPSAYTRGPSLAIRRPELTVRLYHREPRQPVGTHSGMRALRTRTFGWASYPLCMYVAPRQCGTVLYDFEQPGPSHAIERTSVPFFPAVRYATSRFAAWVRTGYGAG